VEPFRMSKAGGTCLTVPASISTPPERYLDLREVCRLTSLSPKTVRRLTRAANGLPVCRVSSRCLRWPESGLHQFMRERAERGA
jgi:predicted DNA-binding transcriptional regulator AlpA